LFEKFAQQILSWKFYFNYEKNFSSFISAGDFTLLLSFGRSKESK